MVESANEYTDKDDLVTFYVFTDDPQEAEKIGERLDRVKIKAFEIPAYRWPEATLFRYSIFYSHFEELDTDIIVHLDADMLMLANPWSRVRRNLLTHNVCLVSHPGFWRPPNLEKVRFYIRQPSRIIADIATFTRKSGLGDWEGNINSSAFTPKSRRKNYYCGGIWFGSKQAIESLLKELANNVRIDYEKSITAIWHDESHLNCWASLEDHGTENPELCFDETYEQLEKLTPLITAVRKQDMTR